VVLVLHCVQNAEIVSTRTQALKNNAEKCDKPTYLKQKYAGLQNV
jgi:hypothetical protein